MRNPKLVFVSSKFVDINKNRVELNDDHEENETGDLLEGIQEGDFVIVTDEKTITNIKVDPRFTQTPINGVSFSAPVFEASKLSDLNTEFQNSAVTHILDDENEQQPAFKLSRVHSMIVIEKEIPTKNGSGDKMEFETILDLRDADLDEDAGQPVYPKLTGDVLALK